MTKYTNFDRTNLKTFRVEMQELLNKYGVNSNVEFTVGNMSFTKAEVNVKISAKIAGAKTIGDSVLESISNRLGLILEKNGAKLVSYDSKKHKYPFIYEIAGKRYKTSEAGARARFAA